MKTSGGNSILLTDNPEKNGSLCELPSTSINKIQDLNLTINAGPYFPCHRE